MTEKKTTAELIIENTRPSAILLPPVAGLENPEESKGKLLLPGENNVSKECWAKAKTNPAIKLQLGVGTLKNRGSGEATPILRDWTKLTIAQGSKFISAVSDIENLNHIKGQVVTKGLKDACDARIAEVLEENEAKNA